MAKITFYIQKIGLASAIVWKLYTRVSKNHTLSGITKTNMLTLTLFLWKRFGYFRERLYLCITRTRQASQRCSNVRVVLFLYNAQQNCIPEAIHQCTRPCLPIAVKRFESHRTCPGWTIPWIYRLLPFVCLYVSFITDTQGATSL